MSDRELRIRIGASIDASFNQVLTNVVDAVKRARKQIRSEVTASAKAIANAEKEAAKEISNAQSAQAKATKITADSMKRDVERSAKERIQIERSAMKEVEKDLRAHNRERARMAQENARIFREEEKKARDGAKTPRDLSRSGALFVRAASTLAHGGMRLAASTLSGFGVDTSLTGMLHGAIGREKEAVDLASQGYIGSGKGPAGSQTYTNPQELLQQATNVGIETGTATQDVLEGATKFVRMTGDLQTARDTMEGLGKVAKANGSDFGEMMEAAANVSIAMGDIPAKGDQVVAVMRTIAGQGHLGAVTIKDLATQMGKLTGQANFFKIDPLSARTLSESGVTNETAQRVAVMGAMTQYARAKGGRTSAKQAAQSAMAFIRDMSSPTEVKGLARHGITPFTDETKTQVRDPMQIIMEVFKQGQRRGGIGKDIINDVFKNQQSRAVATSMLQDYDAAYKKAGERGITDETKRHQAALESLSATFQNYLRVTQSAEEVQLKFNAAMGTAESQTTVFNNRIGAASDEMAKALLPAVRDLTPALVAATKAVAGFFGWLTKSNEQKQDKEQRAADLEAFNDISLLTQATKKGKISAAEQKKVLDDKTRLEEQIKTKETEVSKEGEGRRGPLGALGIAGKQYKNMLPDELANEAKSDSDAAKYIQDQKQLGDMKTTLEMLGKKLDVLEVLKNMNKVTVTNAEPLQVKIVGDDTKSGGAVRPETSGTSSGDSGDIESH